jgi:holliday junction DNA helicase RuvA
VIESLTGQLVDVQDGSVVLERSGVGYFVSVPRYAVSNLAPCNGQEVKLHTLLFIDGQQGGQLEPQLVGFPNSNDKLFFRRFISVKGMGWRKALKALTDPIALVARWIEEGDAKALKQLPGIGGRGAELIIAELKGKLADFASAADSPIGAGDALSDAQRDAMNIMIALGDGRGDAENWLSRVGDQPSTATAEDWVRAAYRVRAGVNG